MKPMTKTNLWDSLTTHAHTMERLVLNDTNKNKQPFNAFACNINLDYSNQQITPKTLELLHALAESVGLRDKINSLMNGDIVNCSENRPALHTALRASGDAPVFVDGHNVMPEIIQTRHSMQEISEQIRSKQWLGYSGKPITNIVNIGIGGSDLGPRFCLKAFANLISPDFNYYFISDVDPTSFKQTVATLEPETTLFIIASKSFTTQETLYNARKAIAWIGDEQRIAKHCIAITANVEKAHQYGIKTILPIWDWVGGRYSLCSAINLITAIAIGFEAFSQLLAGANSMDLHFRDADFKHNLPVLFALLGIWNNNFLHRHSLLMLTYSQQLEQFVPYIQQLDMESNGKCIDNQGNKVNHSTGPIIWGGLGNQAQHSYYQLLCQGTHQVVADFITMNTFDGKLINDMCSDKIRVLTSGVNDQDNPNGHIPGNLPLNHIRINDGSPFTIGALISLYEHKIFTQGVIWDINPFDQPGVESAKRGRRTHSESQRISKHLI